MTLSLYLSIEHRVAQIVDHSRGCLRLWVSHIRPLLERVLEMDGAPLYMMRSRELMYFMSSAHRLPVGGHAAIMMFWMSDGDIARSEGILMAYLALGSHPYTCLHRFKIARTRISAGNLFLVRFAMLSRVENARRGMLRAISSCMCRGLCVRALRIPYFSFLDRFCLCCNLMIVMFCRVLSCRGRSVFSLMVRCVLLVFI